MTQPSNLDVWRPSTPPMLSRTPSPRFEGTLYFAYGSDLWQKQMMYRFPYAKYIGVARLRHWRWQINSTGLANLVESPPAPYSPTTARWLGPLMGNEDTREDNDKSYGLVYQIREEEEDWLDQGHIVPPPYVKEKAVAELWSQRRGLDGMLELTAKPQKVQVVFFVDRQNVTDAVLDAADASKGQYRYKLFQGLRNAVKEGVPSPYIEEFINPFLPNTTDLGATKDAIESAIAAGIDIRKLLDEREEKLVSEN